MAACSCATNEENGGTRLAPQQRAIILQLKQRPELGGARATILTAPDPGSGECVARVRRPCAIAHCEVEDVRVLAGIEVQLAPIPSVTPHDAPHGFHPIHEAAVEGQTRAVERYLDSGVDPDLLDRDGWTPLMRACLWAQWEVVQRLLLHGATPDVPARKTGSTALHFACLHGPNRPPPPHGLYDVARHSLTVEALLIHGAQTALRNHKAETPAMWARQSGALEVLSKLGQEPTEEPTAAAAAAAAAAATAGAGAGGATTAADAASTAAANTTPAAVPPPQWVQVAAPPPQPLAPPRPSPRRDVMSEAIRKKCL